MLDRLDLSSPIAATSRRIVPFECLLLDYFFLFCFVSLFEVKSERSTTSISKFFVSSTTTPDRLANGKQLCLFWSIVAYEHVYDTTIPCVVVELCLGAVVRPSLRYANGRVCVCGRDLLSGH